MYDMIRGLELAKILSLQHHRCIISPILTVSRLLD